MTQPCPYGLPGHVQRLYSLVNGLTTGKQTYGRFLLWTQRPRFAVWRWRDDWQAWCPPGWPSREVMNPPYMDKLHALERHGGQPYGRSGAMDERGRPVTPS